MEHCRKACKVSALFCNHDLSVFMKPFVVTLPITGGKKVSELYPGDDCMPVLSLQGASIQMS